MLKESSARSVEQPNRSSVISFWTTTLSSLGLIAVFLGLILGLSLLAGWASMNVPPWLLDLDLKLYRDFVSVQNPDLTRLILLVLNDPGLDYSAPIAACLGYVWWKRRKDMVGAAIAVGLTLVVGASTMQYMQSFGFRPRPFVFAPEVVMDQTWREIWATIPTFPSGHVRELAGLCVVLGYFWPGARWFAFLYLGIVAVTRVYLGAHFPTDVVAGVLVGLLAGAFSVVTVSRGNKIVDALTQTTIGKRLREYLLTPKAADYSTGIDPLIQTFRMLLFLTLLLAAAIALATITHTTTPRILGDYLRNTDNSIVYPIFGRFDATSADVVHRLFLDWRMIYLALAFLALARSVFRGKRQLGQTAVALITLSIVAAGISIVIGPEFTRPRPFAMGEFSLPAPWRSLWAASTSFPDAQLLILTALSYALARQWPSLSVPAYLYPFLAATAALYFGAVWPTDAIATLILGYLVSEHALFVSRQFLGTGDSETGGSDTGDSDTGDSDTGDRYTSDW